MAVLRFLLVAGLPFAASLSVADDTSNLIQREVGVHGPEGGPEEPPSEAMNRIEASTRDQLLSGMGTVLEHVGHFLAAAETPLLMLMNEPEHDYEHWTAEKMAVFAAGYALAFRDPKFQPLVNKTFSDVSRACTELGTKMETISGSLDKNTKSAASVKLNTKLLQVSVQQISEVMISGIGGVFDTLSAFLAAPLTAFLKTSSKEMAVFVKHHSSDSISKFNRQELQPFIKKAFEEDAVCDHLKVKVASFGKMAEQITDDATVSIFELKRQLLTVEPHLDALDRKVMPQVIENTREWLQELGNSLSTLGGGFSMYHQALARAATERLNCTLPK